MIRAHQRLLDDTLSAIERIGLATSAAAVLEHLASAAGQYGYSALVLTKLPHPSESGGPQILLNGWPGGWSERYEAAGHFEHDPIAKHCVTTAKAFSWNELPAPLIASTKASRIVSEASEFQLREGLCVPLASRGGLGGLSLAGEKVEDSPGLRQAISLLAYRADEALEASWIASEGRRELTPREGDVLSWIARGKTVSDVGAILGISEHTVGEHLKNIRRKLGASNSAHSVVKALQRGLLRL